jgi:hypothetical protein
MQTTLSAARSVPAYPSETQHDRRLFGRARLGRPRTLDALVEQGRYFLAHRDSVRQAEAAAAVASPAGSSTRAQRQLHEDARLGRSAARLPAKARRMFQRCFRDLPPFQLRKPILTVPWSGALEVLARFPGRALLQPDGIQVLASMAVAARSHWSLMLCTSTRLALFLAVRPAVRAPLRRCKEHGGCTKLRQRPRARQCPLGACNSCAITVAFLHILCYAAIHLTTAAPRMACCKVKTTDSAALQGRSRLYGARGVCHAAVAARCCALHAAVPQQRTCGRSCRFCVGRIHSLCETRPFWLLLC